MLNYPDKCLRYEMITDSIISDENRRISENIYSDSNEKILYNNDLFLKKEPNFYDNYEDLFINKVKLF